jgi:hypothetical protein
VYLIGRVLQAYVVVYGIIGGQCRVTKPRRRSAIHNTRTDASVDTCEHQLNCGTAYRDCHTYTILLGSSSRRSGTASHLCNGSAFPCRVPFQHRFDILFVILRHCFLRHILCLADLVVVYIEVGVDRHFVSHRSLAVAAYTRMSGLVLQPCRLVLDYSTDMYTTALQM